MKKFMCCITALLTALSPAAPALAHGGGHGGGGGFHGGFGGFHGGGMPGGFGGFGGFRGGGVPGGYGGYHPSFSAPAFNRTPSFSMPRSYTMPRTNMMPRTPMNYGERFGNVNRGAAFGNTNRGTAFSNINRGTAFTNINRGNTFNNVNRLNTFNNVNRMGYGWNNPYMGYHQGWVHGYWNGHYPGGFGWRPWGYGYGGYGGWGGWGYGGLGLGLGMGLGWGLSSWLYGPMLYNWGYSNYYNPYWGYGAGALAAQPLIYDYGLPIDAQAAAPDQTVADPAVAAFDTAREAFKAGDYDRALGLVDQAIKSMPNDATLHEFRGLCLFALKRYDEAAAALYAVLTAGPGWDWTTLISLYNDPEVYTQQLRALEAYCKENPNSAPGRFVLAYHYLTDEHPDAAVRQLKAVVALEPKDTLSAQLITQLESSQKPAGGADLAQAPGGLAPAPNVPAAPAVPPGKQGKLEGTWTAEPNDQTKITLVVQGEGRFSWKVAHQGKEQEFAGRHSFENGILTLVQDRNNNTMVGNVTWQDENHFSFKVLGGPPGDPGLSFARSS